jgi:MSHA biogenesis protein MshP
MYRKQQGLGLIMAIFLIVVVAALAVGVTSLVRTGASAFVQDVLSYKAFLAAESGAQIAMNRVFAPVGIPSCVNQTQSLNQPGLESCTANVTCTSVSVSGAATYTIDSAGRCATGSEVAERHVVVRARP